jgi:hypothetical protein
MLGSPIIKNGYLISIIADSGNNCNNDDPKLTTAIYPYYPWIMEKLDLANRGTPWV